MKHFIDLKKAKALTKTFRQRKDSIVRNEHSGKHLLPNSLYFDRDSFDILLAKSNCKGLRFYFGMDGADQVSLVAVGVNDKGEDMLTTSLTTDETATTEEIIDEGVRCPTQCPPDSPLNKDETNP
jgi:hypothetical protein